MQRQSLPDARIPTPHDLIGPVQGSFAILESLASHPEGVSVRQVSQTTQLNLSTCYHVPNTLATSGYALKDTWSRLYRPTGKIGFMAQGRCTPAFLLAQLTQHAQSPQDATRETAYLSLWAEAEIVLSAVVESPLPVRAKALDIGTSDANHASALGTAILAYLPDGQADAYLSRRDCAAYRTAFPPLVQEAARAATRNLLILGCASLSRPL